MKEADCSTTMANRRGGCGAFAAEASEMAVLVDGSTRVIVQGITGKSGILQTKSLLDYGTSVVAGVTPGKGGAVVEGVPVFDSVLDAMKSVSPNAAISFVPPMFAKDAAIEAMEVGIKLLVLTMEGIPKHDVLDILSMLKAGACACSARHGRRHLPGKCIAGRAPCAYVHGGEGGRGLQERALLRSRQDAHGRR